MQKRCVLLTFSWIDLCKILCSSLVSKERTCLHFCIQSPSYSFIMEVDFYRKIQGRKVLFAEKFVQRHMNVSLNFEPWGDFLIYLNQFEVQCCATEMENQYISTI